MDTKNERSMTPMPETSKEVKNLFINAKHNLKKVDFPGKLTEKVANYMYVLNKSKVLSLISDTSKTILITVPSTSGKNILPILYAKEFKKNGLKMIEGSLLTKPDHYIETKSKVGLTQRILDPINFSTTSEITNIRHKITAKYRKVFLVDDIMTTGENAIKFKKVLEANGIKVDGLLPMVTIGKYKPSEKDFDHAIKIFNQNNNLTDKQQIDIRNKLKTVFADYSRYKLFRFTRTITPKNISPDQAIAILNTGNLQEKAFNMKNKSQTITKNTQTI